MLAQRAASLAERFDPVPDSVVDAARAAFASRAVNELGRDREGDADSGGDDNDNDDTDAAAAATTTADGRVLARRA